MKKTNNKSLTTPPIVNPQADFAEISALITAARQRSLQAVNTTLIELYWQVGQTISRKIEQAQWGDSVVMQLAEHLARNQPGLRGFTWCNLFRMRQFYEAYRDNEIVSALLRQLPWTHNLIILNQSQRPEEREFYLRMAIQEKWSKRELERQFKTALFERTVLSPAKLSPLVTVLHPDALSVFKDSYLVEFLDLPQGHAEADLHQGLLQQLKQFLIELGRDFCFVGSEYPLQVGGRDFALDLLFFHRGLNCLIAIELKVGRFEPEYLGKLPLAEQQRIVAKVDELMALCDQLEAAQQERERRRDRLAAASLQRLNQPAADTTPEAQRAHVRFHLQHLPCLTTRPEHIKAMRQTIFSLATEGRLIPQLINDEHAAVSLLRLGLEIESNVSENSVLPETWCYTSFEQVAAVTGGVTLGRKLMSKKTIDLPYLRVANVKRGELDLNVLKVIAIGETELDRYALKLNDLLLTEGGDWDKVGRAAIWREEIPLCLHQNHIFRARLRSSELSARWFELYFNAPAGRAYFESSSKQTTNLASINMRQVRACPVPIPPLAEQHRIVAKVDALMALCDQLEAQLSTTQTNSRRLLESVLEAALAPA